MIGALLLAAARVVTLQDAVDSARSHQPQLKQAQAQTEAAGARADQALAPMLPQLSASASYLRTTANAIQRPGAPPLLSVGRGSSLTTFPSLSDNINLSLLLFDFGATPFRWKAAQSNAQAASDNERATALQVDFNVRSAYFDARANRALVKVAAETLANQERHLAQTEGFVQAGTHPEIDLVQARTDTANARVQLITAENAYETSKVTLNAAMGVVGPTDYDVSDEAMPPLSGEDAASNALFEEAMQARPEVASLDQQVRAAQLTLRSLHGQYLPSLNATAGFTQGGEFLDRLGWNASAGVTLSWQIFQGGLTRAQVHEAEANLAAAAAQLDLLRQQVRADIDAARLAVRAAKATLSATQEALVNARERLRLAEQRFQVGVGSAIELGDAQVALTQAAAQSVQADDRLSTARAQLLRALGRQ